MNDAPRLALSCVIDDAGLDVIVRNEGDRPVRLWRRDNSWGWETVRLLVGDAAHADARSELRPTPVIWTRNGPGYYELAPGEAHLERIAFGDVTWEGLEAVRSLAGLALDVEPVLDVPPSPEALAADVFVGRVAGHACHSKPPHRWLFG